MQYKLIAVDVDGTLLDNHHQISKRNYDLIHKAIEKGIIFVIGTGRPIQGVNKVLKMLHLDKIPLITYNGGIIYDDKNRDVIYQQLLDPEDAIEIILKGEKESKEVIVWSEGELFVNKINDLSRKYTQLSGVLAKEYDDIDTLTKRGITKIIWYDTVEKIEELKHKYAGNIGENVNSFTSYECFLEFVHKNVNKGIAMKKLGEHYNIRQEEMIAIGDGFNDVDMITYAGLGVAMGNAHEDIKKHADFITKSNVNDGVAHVIEKFIL